MSFLLSYRVRLPGCRIAPKTPFTPFLASAPFLSASTKIKFLEFSKIQQRGKKRKKKDNLAVKLFDFS